ncbi:MAG: DNA polymerase III subunit delta [Thermosynechococcaceae cyanobacterium]
MPVYLYWGEDHYRLNRAVDALYRQVLDPAWLSFNYDKIEVSASADANGQMMQGFNQAMTPPFGAGQRLVWLLNPTLGKQDSDDVISELQRTLPALPETSHLLLTYTSKPNGRSKAIKLLQKQAQVQEFSPIPPWKTQLLVKAVQDAASEVGVKLSSGAVELLAESVGNDTQRLYTELDKLQLYAKTQSKPLSAEMVARLVPATAQNSLQLADAIRRGQTSEALTLVAELLALNEPGLKITATLVRQFRTWLWIKLMIESGERDERAIAKAAEVHNPKRIYFLQQDVKSLHSQQLLQALSGLLDLDLRLKKGQDPHATLQTKVIELAQVCQPQNHRQSPYR